MRRASAGTVEVIHGLALLVFGEQDDADYARETESPDGKAEHNLPLDVRGQVALECPDSAPDWQATTEWTSH